MSLTVVIAAVGITVTCIVMPTPTITRPFIPWSAIVIDLAYVGGAVGSGGELLLRGDEQPDSRPHAPRTADGRASDPPPQGYRSFLGSTTRYH